MILSSLLVLAGGRSLYYQQYPVQWYPGYPRYPLAPLQTVAQLRDCGLFGCIDDTATSVRQAPVCSLIFRVLSSSNHFISLLQSAKSININ